MLLEQPEEEFVAGDHGEGADASSSRGCHVQAMVINGVPWRPEVSSPAVPAHRVQCHDGSQRTEGKRCLKSPANALIASGSIENTTG